MVEIKNFNAFQDFLNYNAKELNENYFVYYHLFAMIERLEAGQGNLYSAYNIADKDGHFIICVWITGAYFIYGNDWTEEMLEFLVLEVDLKRFNDFNFIGQRTLVLQLFEKSNVE